jgi:microcystin-dependent protein
MALYNPPEVFDILDVIAKPVGSISIYSALSTIPTNELILSGTLNVKQEVDRTLYSDLYSVIGDTYGTPLVGTNFVLPPIVGLLPKGGTVLNYTDSGGSDILGIGNLPQHSHNLLVNSAVANSDVAAGNYLSSSESSSGAGLMSDTPTNLEQANEFSIGLTGSGNPHEHPYQNFIYTICFESVAYGVVSPTPNLQQVTDIGNTTTNSIIVNDINSAGAEIIVNQTDVGAGIDNQLRLEGGSLLVRDIANGNFTLIGTNGFQFTRNNTNTISLDVNTLSANRNQAYQDKSGTIALVEDLPIFLNETSTIADFVTGRTHYYIGEAPITYDYDLEPYPVPVLVQNFNFVNLSVYDVFFTSDFGNYAYTLKPLQGLKDITIIDGGGVWQLYTTEYIDNIYDLQQVTTKGATTQHAIIVRNNPDTYRTRYSIVGQQVQRDDLGFELEYIDTGITKTATGTKSWELQIPDLTANANSSNFLVDFRSNVSGTVAYLSDVTEKNNTLSVLSTSTTTAVNTKTNIGGAYLGTKTILANTLIVGSSYLIKIEGLVSSDTNNNMTVGIEVEGVTVPVIVPISNTTNQYFSLEFLFTFNTTGVNGKFRGQGRVHLESGIYPIKMIANSADVNTTLTVTLNVSTEFSAGTNSIEITNYNILKHII